MTRALRGIAFVGGGSGGHLYPGIAVAERARECFPDCRLLFLRTQKDVEERVFAGSEFESGRMSLRPPGRHPQAWWRYSRSVVRAMRSTRAQLRRGIDLVVGLGGYASLPGLLAARSLGLPTLMLEQNRKCGRVNRLAASFVDVICCSHEGVDFGPVGRRTRVVVTGNPVRRAVVEAARRRARRPSGGARKTIVVVGGSQGARGLNFAVREALPSLAEFRSKILWIHVAGSADKKTMVDAYRNHRCWANVLEYAPRLPDLLAGADLALARAGGTTLAELTVLGVPSVLVPYPHHRDQHQLANAQALAEAGGGWVLPEAELSSEALRSVLRDRLFSPSQLAEAASRALEVGRPEAADGVLEVALELVEGRCRSLSESLS